MVEAQSQVAGGSRNGLRDVVAQRALEGTRVSVCQRSIPVTLRARLSPRLPSPTTRARASAHPARRKPLTAALARISSREHGVLQAERRNRGVGGAAPASRARGARQGRRAAGRAAPHGTGVQVPARATEADAAALAVPISAARCEQTQAKEQKPELDKDARYIARAGLTFERVGEERPPRSSTSIRRIRCAPSPSRCSSTVVTNTTSSLAIHRRSRSMSSSML